MLSPPVAGVIGERGPVGAFVQAARGMFKIQKWTERSAQRGCPTIGLNEDLGWTATTPDTMSGDVSVFVEIRAGGAPR